LTLTTPIIVASYAEIALKGRNRPVFLRRLINNIRVALRQEAVKSIRHVESRLLIHLSDPQRAEAVVGKMRKVFGLQWVSSVVPVPRQDIGADLAGLSDVAAALAKRDCGSARHFKVDTRRSDRSFPFQSPEINRIVGTKVQEAIQLPARMHQPDFTLHILLLKENALVFSRKLTAHGGLPAGSGGRVMVLLSGGIDSPVAAWLMMKRGCHPEFVHFFSGRHQAEADLDKMQRLVTALLQYSPVPLNLFLVPVYAYEARAIGRIEEPYDMVMFRRFMVKTAALLARRTGCLGLVTGDSLGQVASQTLANMAAISSDLTLPIYRPLIGMDKYEITDIASAIETYKISIEPYRDCCSIRSPHPTLKAQAEDLLILSEDMELEDAVKEAVASSTQTVIGRGRVTAQEQ